MRAVVRMFPSEGDSVELVRDVGFLEAGSVHEVVKVYHTDSDYTVVTKEGNVFSSSDVIITEFKDFVSNFVSLESLINVLQSMSGMELVVADLSDYADHLGRCSKCGSKIDFERNLEEGKMERDLCTDCQ